MFKLPPDNSLINENAAAAAAADDDDDINLVQPFYDDMITTVVAESSLGLCSFDYLEELHFVARYVCCMFLPLECIALRQSVNRSV